MLLPLPLQCVAARVASLFLLPVSTLWLSAARADPVLTQAEAELVAALRGKGFQVVFQHPPVKKAYGLFVAKRKILYVSPLAFELGIGQSVLVHEAIHAAQSCPTGVMSPIGWNLTTSKVVANEISGILTQSYHANKHLEREAFLGQAQVRAIPMVISALAKRCRQ